MADQTGAVDLEALKRAARKAERAAYVPEWLREDVVGQLPAIIAALERAERVEAAAREACHDISINEPHAALLRLTVALAPASEGSDGAASIRTGGRAHKPWCHATTDPHGRGCTCGALAAAREESGRLREALRAALEAMAPCVVGWEEMGMEPPAWVLPLRQAVLAIQGVLGIPLDDGGAALAWEDGGNGQ